VDRRVTASRRTDAVAAGPEYKAAALRVITWAWPRAGPLPAPAPAPAGVRWPAYRRRLRRMDSTPPVSPV